MLKEKNYQGKTFFQIKRDIMATTKESFLWIKIDSFRMFTVDQKVQSIKIKLISRMEDICKMKSQAFRENPKLSRWFNI